MPRKSSKNSGSKSSNTQIAVLLWNVCGPANKLQDDEFIKVLSETSLFVLTETRMIDDFIHIPGYKCVHAPHRTLGTRKPTERTGGVLVGIREEIMYFIIECRAVDCVDSFVYIKMDGTNDGLCSSVVHFVCVYMPHRQSIQYDSW